MTNAEIIEIIKMEGTATRGLMRSEIDRIHEMDKLRNGRLARTEEDVRELKCDTRFFRMMHRNPKLTAIIITIFVMTIALGAHNLNVKRTIEKLTKIELND